MAQQRMRGVSSGHDGALARLQLPVNAALLAADKTVLGPRLLAIAAGIGLDQPTDHRLWHLALRQLRRVKQAEVKQAVGLGGHNRQQSAKDQYPTGL